MTTTNKHVENKPTGLSRADNPAVAADPPAASDIPLRGQIETNQPGHDDEPALEVADRDTAQQLAYDFGRRAALERGRDRSSPLDFDSHEAQLEHDWSELKDGAKISWQRARDSAKDAWNKVQQAIVGDQP